MYSIKKSLIHHYIITRFSVGYTSKLKYLNTKEIDSWFCNRLLIFEKYSYKSISDQKQKNFKWLIFFDYRTPAVYIEQMLIIDTFNIVEICFTYFDEFNNLFEFNKSILHYINLNDKICTYDILVTTRTDSDDMISPCFIYNIQLFINNNIYDIIKHGQVAVNIYTGYIYHSNLAVIHKRRLYSNPFITLIDSTPNPTSVFFTEHSHISNQIHTYNLDNDSFFFQIVHGSNILNSLIGIPIFFISSKLKQFMRSHKIILSSSLVRIYQAFIYYVNKIIYKLF